MKLLELFFSSALFIKLVLLLQGHSKQGGWGSSGRPNILLKKKGKEKERGKEKRKGKKKKKKRNKRGKVKKSAKKGPPTVVVSFCLFDSFSLFLCQHIHQSIEIYREIRI